MPTHSRLSITGYQPLIPHYSLPITHHCSPFAMAFGFGFGWHAIVDEVAKWAGAFKDADDDKDK